MGYIPVLYLCLTALVNHPTVHWSSPGIVELWSGICPIQAAMYNEDFVNERKDRENLHARLLRKEEELAAKEKELQSMRQRFEEELQTKNQQVKQYKRQVDAVKADLDKCQMDLNQVTVCACRTHVHLHIIHSTCICTFVLYMYCVHATGCVSNCGAQCAIDMWYTKTMIKRTILIFLSNKYS